MTLAPGAQVPGVEMKRADDLLEVDRLGCGSRASHPAQPDGCAKASSGSWATAFRSAVHDVEKRSIRAPYPPVPRALRAVVKCCWLPVAPWMRLVGALGGWRLRPLSTRQNIMRR